MKARSRVTTAVAAAALLLAATTSCAGPADPADPPPTSAPSSATPTPTPTPSETPRSESDVAADNASELLRRYYEVRDQLRQDPTLPLGALEEIAISTELSAQKNLFRRERRDGRRQIGETKIVELQVQSVSLDNADPKAGIVPTVQIDVCYDVSDVDIVDGSGDSVVTDERRDTGWIRYSVANYEWDTDPTGAWRVASSESIEQTPCAAS